MKKYLVGFLMVICALLIIFSAVYLIAIMKEPGVEKIVLFETNLTLEPGMSHSLEYAHFPESLPLPTVSWSSSDEKVVSVDNGIISARQTGNATVRVQAGNVYAECNITVIRSVLSVSLSPSYVDLELHEQRQLSAKLQPADASFKNITWSSDDESIASVDNDGIVYANSPGRTTITAAAHNGVVGICNVVVSVSVSDLIFDETELFLNIHETHTLTYKFLPENATKTELTWESDNNEIISVSPDGVLSALSGGTTFVRARTRNGIVADCKVTVVVRVEKITLSYTELSLETDEIFKLTAEVYPKTAALENLIWESSNPDVAVVSPDGSVIAIAPGIAVISASLDGVAAACDVVVSNAEPFLKIQESIVLRSGENSYPDLFLQNIRADELTYTSSEPKVAVVSDGIIKALSAGNATITAKAPCGIISACDVTVLTPSESIEYHFTGPSDRALSLTLDIPINLYNSYKNTPSNDVYFEAAYPKIIRDIRDDVFFSYATKKFRALASENAFSETELIYAVSFFVQNMPGESYTDLITSNGRPKYPVETLFERQGTYVDASLLLAAIFDSLGYDVALVFFEDHMAVGLSADADLSGLYFPYMGKLFFYVEASIPGFSPGRMPDRLRKMEAVLILI